jgi:plastocyanin
MKTQLLILGVLALLCDAARSRAGTVLGSVRAEGKAGLQNEAACGPYESRKYKFVPRLNYAEFRDFVVFLEGPVPGPWPPEARATRRVVQRDAQFIPHVLPIPVGTTVEWPNEDDILHNVFSISETKPFDLDLYKAPVVKRVTFDKPGRVDVFCSIHTTMSCVVLVLENPFFAVSDEKGRYVIREVPAGTYRLKAWHERLPPQVREITVPEKGEVRVDFVLGLQTLPKY